LRFINRFLNIFMTESTYLHELVSVAANRSPLDTALVHEDLSLNYADLYSRMHAFSSGLLGLGLKRGERVGIYLDKRFENVVACFGTAMAGCVFVPINPLLKPEQVAYLMGDCNIRLLVTTVDRYSSLHGVLGQCNDLFQIAIVGPGLEIDSKNTGELCGYEVIHWNQLLGGPTLPGHRVIDTDMVAILYTSGSTGQPKGVVLSHRNMVVGAKSVASYLENKATDRLLAVLPLSFDAGFSQLTTAFHAGAAVVLLNYLMPRDVLNILRKERITGLTAVPPLYIQLAALEWPPEISTRLRYFANTGGRMPLEVLTALRKHLPRAQAFLMYGLTEAFRSTYLPPQEIDRRPDSIGKAIPNVEIGIIRDDGSACGVNEPGELVHRGALVSLGYWNDPVKTAERFKLLTGNFPGRPSGLPLPEYAVYSGDTVRQDAQGFLYFMGRKDEMMKVAGYRISPSEVEEILYATQMVRECVAFSVAHPVYGSAIQVIAAQAHQISPSAENDLKNECRRRMPSYMVPEGIHWIEGALPRNPNGKIDRKLLIAAWHARRLLTAGPAFEQHLSEASL
jgi:acyl-CoA ligase (AMP-forming) (exosortase A-associated)